MNYKRGYQSEGYAGYGEDGPKPPKMQPPPAPWSVLGQADYGQRTDGRQSGYGTINTDWNMSYMSGTEQSQARGGGGGVGTHRITDRLRNMSGSDPSSSASSYQNQPSGNGHFTGSVPSYGSYDYKSPRQRAESYDYGNEGQYGKSYDYGSQSQYSDDYGRSRYDSGYDQNYGTRQESDWSYGQDAGDYYDTESSFDRGQSQGQPRGKARGAPAARGQAGFGNQVSRGLTQGQPRGQGYAGGRGQARGQSRGQVRGQARGQGRGQARGQTRGQTRGHVPQGRGRGTSAGGRGSVRPLMGGSNSPAAPAFSSPQAGGMRRPARGTGRGFTRTPRGRGAGRGALSRGGQLQANPRSQPQANPLGLAGKRGRGRGGGVGRGGTGGKLSSLMDLVDSAWQRKYNTSALPSGLNDQARGFAQFHQFFSTYGDGVNGIVTISNAVTASQLRVKVDFEAEDLMFVTKSLFTGVLSICGFFMTRGLGLSKKAVKHDCFERAVQMLRTMTVEEIMNLEDCGKEALQEEVKLQSEQDFLAFKSFLDQKQKSSNSISTAGMSAPNIGVQQSQVAVKQSPGSKTGKVGPLEGQGMAWNVSLADKLTMLLKNLNTTEGSGIALASRFDIIAFKVGISVATLFRAVNPNQARRFNPHIPRGDQDYELICELYYDFIQVAQGRGKPRKEAQIAAYNNLHQRLMSESISAIAQGSKLAAKPQSLPDFYDISYKGSKPQEGNNRQIMLSQRTHPPDLQQPLDNLVIIETCGDTIENNAYKILELSASKCSMLVEWKQLQKVAQTEGFRCEVNLNRQRTEMGMGQSKAKARNAAAAAILMDLYLTQDVLNFNLAENFSAAITMSTIMDRAQELKAEGPPRDKTLQYNQAKKDKPQGPDDKSQESEGKDQESEVKDQTSEVEGKPSEVKDGSVSGSMEEWMTDPLRPWIEDAVLELMETYQKKLTLEELIIGPNVSPGLNRCCYACARQCLLTSPSVRKDHNKQYFLAFHHRGLLPQEMVKILHINKNASGRYTLVRANKPLSITQQAEFVRSFPNLWMSRARAFIEAELQKKEEIKQKREEDFLKREEKRQKKREESEMNEGDENELKEEESEMNVEES